MKTLSRLQVMTIAAVFAVGGLFAGAPAELHAAGRPGPAIGATAVVPAPMMPTTFAPIVKAVLPAVVNISSSKMVAAPQGPDMQMFPGFQMPQEGPQRGQRQGPQQGAQKESAEGSGVIVSADGYILTNNHVIDGATELKVTLADKREMTATVVGADPGDDVALLKVDASNLPFVQLGDSDNVAVGDIALAIGNPFGLGQTVTMGIVSAKGRTGLGIEDYENFIQTDASINPGNSGGALIDMNGRLIGINTAILSGNGGNQGVGFAIPVNTARKVMNELRATGHVTRGFLGITIHDLTPGIAAAFGSKVDKGVVVAEVTPDSPAAKAGVKQGDVILQADGTPVDTQSLHTMAADRAPGSILNLRIQRDGAQQTISVKLGEMPQKTS